MTFVTISNSAIDHRIDHYSRLFTKLGGVRFELSPMEYENLTHLTKSFHAARKSPAFDIKVWVNEVRDNGLFQDEKSLWVFSFIMYKWSSNLHIGVVEEGDDILVTVSDRTQR